MLRNLLLFFEIMIFSKKVKYLLRSYDLVVQRHDSSKQDSLLASKIYLHMFTYFICLYMFTYFISFLHCTKTHGNRREPKKPWGGGNYVYCMGNKFTKQLICCENATNWLNLLIDSIDSLNQMWIQIGPINPKRIL